MLDRIKDTGDIFLAWPDEAWIVEGAAVHVSIIGFDDGSEATKTIRGEAVARINSDLTAGFDLTQALRLKENAGIAFMGDTKGGPFEISEKQALAMLQESNPDGRVNSDVVRRSFNSIDIARRPRGVWIIDFPPDLSKEEAALYEAPFEYVKRIVKPIREQNRRALYAQKWWIHAEPRPGMRKALKGLSRYIATPTTSKHRLFVWLTEEVLPDHALIVFAKDDDFSFGVLHSRMHQLWALRTGTQLREFESGFRYTPSTTFETFPFPQASDEKKEAVASAAEKLSHLRSEWLGAAGQSEAVSGKRTLTNLYNNPPTWLQNLHEHLDVAVASAYGWPAALSDDEVVQQLLFLNLERAKAQDEAGPSLRLA